MNTINIPKYGKRIKTTFFKGMESSMHMVYSFVKSALIDRFTYDVRRNPFLWFGIFWGIPIPIVVIWLHQSLTSSGVIQILQNNPLYWVFLAHPLLFGVFFGGVGTLYFKFHSKLTYRATHDELTGLLTHSSFRKRCTQRLNEISRNDESATLIMFDLDNFKEINDSLGHQVGDDVLDTVSDILRENTRRSDLLGRYGGEEFIMLLPGTNIHEAITISERIRGNIENESSRLPETLTTSAGGALFPTEGGELGELIDIADENLYAAKEQGRNKVRFSI